MAWQETLKQLKKKKQNWASEISLIENDFVQKM